MRAGDRRRASGSCTGTNGQTWELAEARMRKRRMWSCRDYSGGQHEAMLEANVRLSWGTSKLQKNRKFLLEKKPLFRDAISTTPSGVPPTETARKASRESREQELVVKNLNCLHIGLMQEPFVYHAYESATSKNDTLLIRPKTYKLNWTSL